MTRQNEKHLTVSFGRDSDGKPTAEIEGRQWQTNPQAAQELQTALKRFAQRNAGTIEKAYGRDEKGGGQR